ncbi:hypothetical protein K488DRAFT_79611 [Vararia minispora EC-137]|uniref:Uncharacterized protein n=1 Tax=Vararia minispora EC-137 TaxID=1314806 RepID=A0ACB8QFK7_9AGAM|nr:hypothetical protein K488DRAFT_79611 [Vararia minispora EC-137]
MHQSISASAVGRSEVTTMVAAAVRTTNGTDIQNPMAEGDKEFVGYLSDISQDADDLYEAGNDDKKDEWSVSGTLHIRRAYAIESCLHILVVNKKGMMKASAIVAEAHQFSPSWGARLVRRWTQQWIQTRALPESNRGWHEKISSILSDPAVRAAISTYLRSHKWCSDPTRLQKLLKNELTPDEAGAYAQKLVSDEMPRGLKQYLESTVLPSLHLKPTQLGLSFSSMRRLMHNEGFKYMASWVLDGEQPIKKKGAGRGIHCSEFICSTVGRLEEAGEQMEYGKQGEGYWNGEKFCKQLKEKFFSAFEKAYGPGHIAVVLVDNSQGHSFYADDALCVSNMNLRPGGKQSRLHDGWFIDTNGGVIVQPMIFPPDHKEFPDQPKEHCDYTFDTLRKNIKIALRSVSEHRAWRFIEAYSEGLEAKAAQKQVKEFSSRRYASHRRIPEHVAQALDT